MIELSPRRRDSLELQYEGDYVLSIVRAILKKDPKRLYEYAQNVTECRFTQDLTFLATEVMSYSGIDELCDKLNVPQEWFERYYDPEWEDDEESEET